jgi:AAA family ATP:ADP antiporter
VDLKKQEWSYAALMSSCFFVFISIFWILKPLKKTYFITAYDQAGVQILGFTLAASQAELVAKILNLLVAIFAAFLFAKLSKQFRKESLVQIFCAISVTSIVLLKATLTPSADVSIWGFYLFGDFFIMMMLASFFAFLSDVSNPSFAKRLYGFVGFGGVAGGVFGSTVVKIWIKKMETQDWLSICILLVVLLAILALFAGRMAVRVIEKSPKKSFIAESAPTSTLPVRSILNSPYLLPILVIVMCYEMTSTIVDFQFTSSVSKALDGAAIGDYFSTIFATTNAISLLTQLFLTSFIMTRFGVMPALLVLPVGLSLGSAGFLLAPTLLMGSAMSVIDNSFNYSIYQSAREALYVRVPEETLYRAKPVIDIIAIRLAKVVSILLTLVTTLWFSEINLTRWLGLLSLTLLALWIAYGIKVAKQFES